MKIRNILFLLRAQHLCYECHLEQRVVALGTSDLWDDEQGWLSTSEEQPLFILTDVYAMPRAILELVLSTGAEYGQRENSAGDETYFANWCARCGALFGDFYLTGQPSGPFFPETIEAAKNIELLEIPLATELEFDCAYTQGGGEFIRTYTQQYKHL